MQNSQEYVFVVYDFYMLSAFDAKRQGPARHTFLAQILN